jgi:pimeloyl-ACP methyl ester carboxylesterase
MPDVPEGGGTAASTAAGDSRRPPWRKLLREAPAAIRLLLAQLKKPPFADPSAGGGKPVLVLPAFLANDIPTTLLRRTLDANGFRGFGWENGVNLGARPDTLERLSKRLDEVIEHAGSPVAVIGWSLGGLYARELAKRRPEAVPLVITLGTPFSVDLRRNNAWKLYELINDHPVDKPPLPVQVDLKPPVRTIAVWSQRDGIVAPASARGSPGEVDESIQVHCTHNEMVSDPEPLALLVSLLQTRFSDAAFR